MKTYTITDEQLQWLIRYSRDQEYLKQRGKPYKTAHEIIQRLREELK